MGFFESVITLLTIPGRLLAGGTEYINDAINHSVEPSGYFDLLYLVHGVLPAPGPGFIHLFDSQSLSTSFGNKHGFISADGTYISDGEIIEETWQNYYKRRVQKQIKEQGDLNNMDLTASYYFIKKLNSEIENAGGGMMFHLSEPDGDEEEEESSGETGGGKLQHLYGWSVDFTIAVPIGYTVEFGEIFDPNTGKTYQFITNGWAFGVEATAGLNAIYITPKENFKISDLEGTSWGGL